MNLNELPDMSDALRQVYEKKKPELDPVGKEDGDIDNDGKKNDPNDKYLANRRKAIAKSMKKEEVEELEEKSGLYANIHAKRKRGESPAKPGDDDYPAKDAFKKAEKTAKKEAFYFDAEEFEGLVEIDEMTDEQLIDFMLEAIVELAEDDEDLLEIAEALERVELLDEEVEQLDEILGGIAGGLMNMGKKGGFMKGATTGIGGLAGKAMGNSMTGFSKGGKVKKSVKKESVSAMVEALNEVTSPAAVNAARLKASREKEPSRAARMKGAAKEAGKRVKAGAAKGMEMAKPAAKAAVKGAAKGAGYAVGAAQRGGSSLKKSFSSGYKRGKEGAAGKKEAPKGDSKPAAKKDDDDGTGGKLDALLASSKGKKGGSSGGGSSASSGGGESEAPKAKKPGILSRIGTGLKRAVGKTARAVSGGSDKLAKKLGENYDEIANLYESGLFTIEEIENVVEGMKAARKNVGADKCWDGYKAKGTKKKDGKEVPNCVKEEDLEEGSCGGYSEGGKVNIRGNNSAEQKKRLEKKRGMKLDDHPQYKKEEKEGMHRDAKTGEVVKKAEVGKTYYPNMPKRKSSVALRKEKEAMKKTEEKGGK